MRSAWIFLPLLFFLSLVHVPGHNAARFRERTRTSISSALQPPLTTVRGAGVGAWLPKPATGGVGPSDIRVLTPAEWFDLLKQQEKSKQEESTSSMIHILNKIPNKKQPKPNNKLLEISSLSMSHQHVMHDISNAHNTISHDTTSMHLINQALSIAVTNVRGVPISVTGATVPVPNSLIDYIHHCPGAGADADACKPDLIVILSQNGPRNPDERVTYSIDEVDFVPLQEPISQSGTLTIKALKLNKHRIKTVTITCISRQGTQTGLFQQQKQKQQQPQPQLITQKYTVRIETMDTFTSPLIGLEIEAGRVRLALGVDGDQAFLQYSSNLLQLSRFDVIARTASIPGVNLPYMQLQQEVSTTGLTSVLEIVTGALPLGAPGTDISEDLYDSQRAMTVLLETIKEQIKPVEQKGPCQGKYTALDPIIKTYNTKLEVGGLRNFRNWLLSDSILPASPDTINFLRQQRKLPPIHWRVKCDDIPEEEKFYNPQINVGIPISAIGRRAASVNHNNPRHYIDLWPRPSNTPIRDWSFITEFMQRAQAVAHMIVFDARVRDHPRSPFIEYARSSSIPYSHKLQACGLLTLFLYRMNFEVLRAILQANSQTPRIFWDGETQAKNLNVNLVKAALPDVTRLLPVETKQVLQLYFTGKHRDQGDLRAVITFLYQHMTASRDNDHPGDCQYICDKADEADKTQSWVEVAAKAAQIIFQPSVAFNTRYQGETETEFGTALINPTETSPDKWKRYSSASNLFNTIAPYSPMGWGDGLGVVVETRERTYPISSNVLPAFKSTQPNAGPNSKFATTIKWLRDIVNEPRGSMEQKEEKQQ